MVDKQFLIMVSLIVVALGWLAVWFFRKTARGELSISVHTVLLIMLLAVLIIPFALNFSAHLISTEIRHSSGS